ncbi:hypothetical protein F183_A54890 (plasmid) [Bryobacterales bacterium F-183]|nr:hypothetical protein F183_A54890 [Bryobacterales bacterium F-183]
MKTFSNPASRAVALLLTGALLAPTGLLAGQAASAQQTAEPPLQAPEPRVPGGSASRRIAPGAIRLIVLEGHNISNSILTKTSITPVVQVLDSNDQPVPGADVTFEAPPPSTTAPGGMFGKAPIATVKSDIVGQATAEFTPNWVPGRFAIKVRAVLGEQKTETIIAQFNDPQALVAGVQDPPKRWYKNWKWWAVIAAGATAGAILATRAGGGGSPTITITPSPVGIGGPR